MTDQEQLQQELLPIVDQVGAVKIKDDADFIEVGALAQRVKGLQAEVDDTFADIVKAANAAHKQAIAGKDKHMKPLKAAESRLKKLLETYFLQRKGVARVDQAEAQAELKAEVDELAMNEAAALERAGRKDEAEAVLSQAETAILPVGMMGSELPKLPGISFREKYKGRVVDASKLDRKYLIPDQTAIDKVCDALGKDANITGVEVYMEPVVTIRKPKADA